MNRFIDWFHTPARDIFGVALLLIAALVIFVVAEMIPDVLRYIRMSRK